MLPTPPRRHAGAHSLAPPGVTGPTGWIAFACALLLGAVLVAEAVMRPVAGSPDAYQYLDVAANLAEGRGLVQSVPGYNSPRFPLEPSWPQPFTSQPPLYPWLASLAIRAGAEPGAALSALTAAGVVLAWLAGAALAARLWGGTAGALALAGLGASALSGTLTSRVWSDPLAIALGLAALAALERARLPERGALRWAAAAGAAAGLAFLTRYLFGLLLPFGAVWLLLARRGPHRVRAALVFGLVAAAFTVPLLARNLAASGGWFGEPRNPSTVDLAALGANMLHYTWQRLPSVARTAAAVALVLLAGLVAVSRERRSRLRDTLTAGAGLVPLWSLAYVTALVLLRLSIHFDNVGARLLAPVLVTGTLLAAALAVRLWQPPRGMVQLAVAVALLAAAAHAALRIAATPDPHRDTGERSAFMRWLAEAAPPGAVVILEDGVDFAWALRGDPGPRRRIVSFSPAPYMQPLTQADLARFAARWHAPDGTPLYVVVRGEPVDDADWRRRYGDAITDAVAGRLPAGDGLVHERFLGGKHVLRWRSAEEARADSH